MFLRSPSVWWETMLRQFVCVLKFLRRSNQRLFTLFATFKLMFFISIMVYWMAEPEHKETFRSFPLEFKCPLVPSPSPPLDELPTPPGEIFFVDTSDQTNPSFLFMCSVESASRSHPGTRIVVLMKGLVGRNSTLPKHLGISLLSCFSNVEFQPLDLPDLFEGTPLAGWYGSISSSRLWKPYFLPILSDAARIAIMWKFGGIYLDTDFIVLKNLKNFTNALGIQSKYVLNGAFLAFEPRHEFIQLCMQDFVDNYNGWIWGHQGPQLLTRVFKKWCGSRSLQDDLSCKGVQALPQKAFYPITWQNWRKFFEDISVREFYSLLNKTYAVHVWNKKSQSFNFEVTSKVLLAQLYSRHCPLTTEVMKMYL